MVTELCWLIAILSLKVNSEYIARVIECGGVPLMLIRKRKGLVIDVLTFADEDFPSWLGPTVPLLLALHNILCDTYDLGNWILALTVITDVPGFVALQAVFPAPNQFSWLATATLKSRSWSAYIFDTAELARNRACTVQDGSKAMRA